MKFEINTNTLINDIMANNTSAVMLFAPPGTGKTDFLTELAGRYKTVFWFNAVSDDTHMLTYHLIKRVLKNDQKLSRKLQQLLYSKSEFNDDSVIITAVLNYISNIKGNCLMVFERMEKLSKNFDLSLLERLIQHCPTNLKIVISSDNYIDFDYTKFEPIYPKLIDETILIPRNPTPDFEKYLVGLSNEDMSFLIYVGELPSINLGFIDEIYPIRGREVINQLCRKESYIATRDGTYYRPNTLLQKYLKSIKDEYPTNLPFHSVEVERRYADYLYGIKEYFLAGEYFYKLKDFDMMDNCIKHALPGYKFLIATNYLPFSFHYLNLEYKENNYYYRLFYAIIGGIRGKFEESKKNLRELIDIFAEKKEVYCEFLAIYKYGTVLKETGKNDPELKEIFYSAVNRCEDEDLIDLFFLSMISLRQILDIPISEFESKLAHPQSKNMINYVKALEGLASWYFEMGNYKKAMELALTIKEYIRWYVIPHNFIAFRYYDGEIDIAEKFASEALKFALDNDIKKDISLLYCTLGMIDLYYGKVDEALEKYDTAVRLDKNNDRVKFYNIGQRCIVYAKYRDANYAKEVAHIYLKYTESFYPQYVNILQLALSFCYLRLGNNEKAYIYATKCVQYSKTRSTNWLIGMAIATNYMLSKGELKDGTTLVKNILKSAHNFGMDMLLVDYFNDIFYGLFRYAKQNNIMLKYIEKIEKIISKKHQYKSVTNNLKISMFGDVQAIIDGKEIQWKTRKSKDLFFLYLLAGDSGIDRNVIIDSLWKDYLYVSAINNLKTTNNIIRKTLKTHNVGFKLEYINSKYILKVENMESDYIDFVELRNQYQDETELSSQIELMNNMLRLYKDDLAVDLSYKDFELERKSLKQEIIIHLLKLIRTLARQGEFLEAKRFLSSLIIIDRQNDYNHMVSELDGHINLMN